MSKANTGMVQPAHQERLALVGPFAPGWSKDDRTGLESLLLGETHQN